MRQRGQRSGGQSYGEATIETDAECVLDIKGEMDKRNRSKEERSRSRSRSRERVV